MQDRADAYAAAFPHHPRLWVVRESGRDVIYGVWVLCDYRNRSGYFGGYPGNYLDRVHALFPEIHGPADEILHAFSGSLPAGPYLRCDSVQDAELRCDVCDLPGVTARAFNRSVGPFRLVMADPPYAPEHAARYGTRPLRRLTATRALAQITRPGGFLAWLDERWPQHRKTEWVTVGRIFLVTSTERRIRKVSIFERVAT